MIMLDYRCRDCRTDHESLENRPPPETRECPMCGGVAEKVFPAPQIRGFVVAPVSRGKVEPNPVPRRSTVDLADRKVTHGEFRDRQRAARRDEKRAALGIGPRRIYSRP